MKNRRDRESYLASAARHEELIEALSKLSKAKLRDLMRASLSAWKVETLDQWWPDEAN
jgi:DNA-binding GntR family transcriptional regulator